MRDLSVKGVTRRHAGFMTQIAIQFNGGTISLRDNILSGGTSVRDRLESMARMEVSFPMAECIYGWVASFRQTWSHIVVRIDLNPDPGISAATMAARRTAWETTIEARWSNAWGIGRSGELTCPITFDVQWVNSNAHHVVRVQSGSIATNMGNFGSTDSGAVISHEFGHMIGNPDEYPSATCPNRSPVNTGTIMDDNTNTIPARLLNSVANGTGSNVVGL